MKNIENKINEIVDRVLQESLQEKEEKWIKNVEIKKDKYKPLREDIGKMSVEEDELEEGNAFSKARCEAICDGNNSFEVDGKEYELKGVDEKDKKSCGCNTMKESKKNITTLSEEEMIELIQRLVIEQKEAKGLKDTEKTLKASAKVNDEAMKNVNKKMKDYVKSGSNQGYEENPKHFPKGNGEMGEELNMKYHPSDAVEEYIDQIARSGGMENLDYDAIKPNEEWVEMNIMGDSKTGNSSDYANAVKTDANQKVNDRRKKNWLSKLKKQSYKRAVQPVEDVAGNKKSDKAAMSPDDVMAALSENIDKKNKKKINEEINKMKSMFGYYNKTQ
jgi:hypothetical protein